jgi:hypothetical protein
MRSKGDCYLMPIEKDSDNLDMCLKDFIIKNSVTNSVTGVNDDLAFAYI